MSISHKDIGAIITECSRSTSGRYILLSIGVDKRTGRPDMRAFSISPQERDYLVIEEYWLTHPDTNAPFWKLAGEPKAIILNYSGIILHGSTRYIRDGHRYIKA